MCSKFLDMENKVTWLKKVTNKIKKLIKICPLRGTFSLPASRASLSAPRARDSIVALRAPFFLDLALRARSCALRTRNRKFNLLKALSALKNTFSS